MPVDQIDKYLFFHRTLSSYVNAVVKAGFRIEAMVEPVPSEEMLKIYPSFEEDFRRCDFVVFKLIK